MAGRRSHTGASLWEQVLLDAAEPILNSADMLQALDQSASSAESMRELIREHTAELLCARGNPELEFIIRGPDPAFARHRRLLLIVSIAVSASILPLGTIWPILVFILFWTAFYIAITANLFYVGRPPLEPLAETRRVLERLVVGPFLREQINQLLAKNKDDGMMRVTSAPGLAALSEREQVIVTDTMSDLVQLSQTMSSGSIGLSGPRGVGKTTYLRYFCDSSLGVIPYIGRRALANAQDLRLMISAPVEYDTKDFVLHLFAKFCETVLQIPPGGMPGDVSPATGERRLSKVLLGGLLVAIGTALGTYTLLAPKRLPVFTKLDDYLTAAAVALAIGILLLGWQMIAMSLRRIRARRKAGIKDEAHAWLTRIRFLQTMTKEYSGAITIPLSINAGITTTQRYAQLQLTLPELVDQFREFSAHVITARTNRLPESNREHAQELAEQMKRRRQRLSNTLNFLSGALAVSRLTAWLSGLLGVWSMRAADGADRAENVLTYLHQPGISTPQPRIVIGIDEIDRIGTESAERFLNEIKAIFGIRQCLYLVSVSDEALALFEQRVLQGRSVFDSTFDEVVRARELTFESCRQLLRRRIAGIPDTLIAFCQVMSGGLPRDLIRTARQVVETCAAGKTEIAVLVASILADQINALKRSLVSIAGDSHNGSSINGILGLLIRDDWPGLSSEPILAGIQVDLADLQFGSGFKAAIYFYATVGEIFGPTELPKTAQALLDRDTVIVGSYSKSSGHIDGLAYARNLISINEEAAWQLIDAFREANGLRLVPLC
jgi:KAP family P-loop domain